jgi:hypothetical protein
VQQTVGADRYVASLRDAVDASVAELNDARRS